MKNPRKKINPDTQRSLFGEILDWMLAPLLFVWPISIAVTHYFSVSVANYPYDQTLREQVTAISRQVKFVQGKPQISLPGSARAFLRSDEIDSVYFHVVGQGGRLLRHPALAKVAARHGATPAQVAIAWTLRGGNVVSIPKAADPAHVRLNAAAREVELTAEDLATLDAGFAPPRHKRGLAML